MSARPGEQSDPGKRDQTAERSVRERIEAFVAFPSKGDPGLLDEIIDWAPRS